MTACKKIALGGAILCAAGICNTAHAAIQYTVTPLTSSLVHSEAKGINAGGQVLARGFDVGDQVRTYHFDTQSSSYIGSFFATDNNDLGDAVGWTDGAVSHAVIYHHQGSITNIGNVVEPGIGGSTAHAINNAGQVIGVSSSGAFLYQAGQVTWLSNPFGATYVQPYAISNSGYITGLAETSQAGLVQQAYLYKDGTMLGLGTLGGAHSWGNGVNDLGHVVGDSFTSDGQLHAFLFINHQMMDIGPAGTDSSSAADVNSSGQVVGTYAFGFNGIPGSARYRGFLYSNGNTVDLNALIDPASGWNIDIAHAINDRGQIAATGCSSSGCTALLLTPVPEPSTVLYLVLGLGVLGAVKRQRH